MQSRLGDPVSEWPFSSTVKLVEIWRRVLALPIGLQLPADPYKAHSFLKFLISLDNPPLVICVGDVVCLNAIKYSTPVNIYILDQKTLRTIKIEISEKIRYDVLLSCRNDRGTVSIESVKAISSGIEKALRGKKVLINVNGEEDLLVIPALLLSPYRSIIAYGHWSGALVVLPVCEYYKLSFLYNINRMFRELR